MRIAVESVGTEEHLAGHLADLLNTALVDWQITPLLFDTSGIWLISGHVEQQVGTAEYAGLAHALVQRILAGGAVTRTEADLPVMGFIRRDSAATSGGVDDAPPGSERSRWARDAIRCAEAWAIEPTRGDGILIGHPDTGYTLHPNLGSDALDLQIDRDFLDDDDDALDPLISPADVPWPLSFPGHGTTTASVMVGRGSDEAGIVGVAPRSKVVPLRAAQSVVQLFDSDVARAVDHARITGCHVVSISVGGKGFFGLRVAIQRAVDAGMIVLAAAGNNVGIVVAPASYPNCLAVAATGPDDQPWPESSRGSAVDVCAPGWGVHVAGYVWEHGLPVARVIQSSGTSYAATHLAGVAALWLAHHGPDALHELYGSRVQSVFLSLLRNEGSRTPAGWDSAAFGAGIVDAAALLAAPLPTPDELVAAMVDIPADAPLARLSALVDVNPTQLEDALAKRFGTTGPRLHNVILRFEGELAFHLVEAPEFREWLLGRRRRESAPLEMSETVSPAFATTFLGAAREGRC
jgi:subtilisin family serine protease